jgi:molybdenum cofactor synthesis domain-containing protein
MEPRIAVVTVSDTRTFETDLSGPAAIEALQALGYSAFEQRIVADEIEQIQATLLELSRLCHAIFTTGGTGFSARDVTPEATSPLLTKRADNLSELMRLRGLEETRFSHLSRGVSGLIGTCLVVNLPGSPKGAKQGIEAIGHLIPHVLQSLSGDECQADPHRGE